MSGRSDIALNEAGRGEALLLASSLANVRLATIYSSPRRRAIETAEIIAAPRRLPVVTSDDLDEIDFGDWAGQSFADLDAQADWRHWNISRGDAATPSGDTMRAVTARALRHMEAQRGDTNVLCVSHCDVIRGVVAHCLGLSADRLLSFDIDVASLTTIDMSSGTPCVLAINERAA